MTSNTRSFRNFRNPVGCLILLAAFAAAAGCSTAETPGGSGTNMNHVLPSGGSVSGWLVTPSGGTHASTATLDYIAGNGSSGCGQCHGSDLSGGISGVSCFGNPAGCHHDPVANWTTPAVHGATAKKAPGSSGFASCQICHGADFRTPRGELNRTCYSCHTRAPHPNLPWRSPTGSTHIDTDPSNVPVCAGCHRNSNPGTPGCFNNTLCHGAAAPHILGPTWVNPTSNQFHGLTAKQNLSSCQGCHGTPGTTLFNGGPAPTSCQASCHPQAKAHPIRWYQAPQPFPGYVSSHRDSGNQSVACAICHRVDGTGTGPDPGAPSCFSTSFNGVTCHSGGPGGPNHLVPFLGPPHTTTNQAAYGADCANCHSITGVPPNSSAPTCVTCHQSATTLPFTNCTSCHARPPDNPLTTAYPNVAGRHAKHDALASVTGVCGACHNGLDSGSLAHYNRANARPGRSALRVPPGDAAFLATYNAKAGAASFDNATLTCANVSCHGAVTAPSWRTGTISVNTDAGCRACHKLGTASGSPENNSPYSGLHTFHLATSVGGAILCTECHDMANGTTGALNHFRFLNTAQMEGPASLTLEPSGSAANYDNATQSCGTFTCHTVSHSAFPWSGGANHPVPPARFTGTAHTSVTSGTFPASCGGCHFDTGAATKIGPTCTVCHQAGSPLTNLTCTSCHASPPSNPSTTAYPNVDGAHAVHLGLNTPSIPSGTPVTCDTCHSGLGSGTNAHYDRANARTGTLRVQPGDVAFLATYNAQSGVSSFNSGSALSCSNVSCHGGRTTPSWQTSVIDVTTQCTICHKAATVSPSQYNDYYSGEHSRHIGAGILCAECHDMSAATTGGLNHFNYLSTISLRDLGVNTVSTTFRSGTATGITYTAPTAIPGTGRCSGSCHGTGHSSEAWSIPR